MTENGSVTVCAGFGDQLMDKMQVDQHQGLKASEISVTDPHGKREAVK